MLSALHKSPLGQIAAQLIVSRQNSVCAKLVRTTKKMNRILTLDEKTFFEYAQVPICTLLSASHKLKLGHITAALSG